MYTNLKYLFLALIANSVLSMDFSSNYHTIYHNIVAVGEKPTMRSWYSYIQPFQNVLTGETNGISSKLSKKWTDKEWECEYWQDEQDDKKILIIDKPNPATDMLEITFGYSIHTMNLNISRSLLMITPSSNQQRFNKYYLIATLYVFNRHQRIHLVVDRKEDKPLSVGFIDDATVVAYDWRTQIKWHLLPLLLKQV